MFLLLEKYLPVVPLVPPSRYFFRPSACLQAPLSSSCLKSPSLYPSPLTPPYNSPVTPPYQCSLTHPLIHPSLPSLSILTETHNLPSLPLLPSGSLKSTPPSFLSIPSLPSLPCLSLLPSHSPGLQCQQGGSLTPMPSLRGKGYLSELTMG